MIWASARCKSQFGGARLGEACHGAVGRSMVRRSMARVADGSTEGQPSLLLSMGAVRARHGMAGCGGAGKGTARQGSARQALARRGKGHRRWHGGFTLPCHPHKDGCGVIWRGRLALG
jgi:hypothetical protein